MLQTVPAAANREVARRNAAAIAASIGSKVSIHRGFTLGEPDCPYSVRWNTEHFWFGLLVSDSAFVVRSNHKRRFSVEIGFSASLKWPDPTMLAVINLEALSKDLGVEVFVPQAIHGPTTSSALRYAPARALLSKIQFGSIRKLFLSPVQICGVADFASAEQCVEQTSLLRQLQVELFNWNQRRDA